MPLVRASPAFDEDLSLVQRINEFPVQPLIPQLPITLKDSTDSFSHGLPGSMNKGATASTPYQARKARAINSGPFAPRMRRAASDVRRRQKAYMIVLSDKSIEAGGLFCFLAGRVSDVFGLGTS